MRMSELAALLVRLSRLYAHGGAKTQGNELQALADAVSICGEESVEDYVKEVKAQFSRPKAQPRTKQPKALDESLLQRYAEQLSNADEHDALMTILAVMKKDKKFDRAHLQEFARRYTGEEAKAKSVAAEYERIENSFVENKRFENKLSAARLS